ncbi:DNA adenine methylase [Clostridium butyricum]|uniref:DNA adenine methylase n=1 Tax=Clostridium butyricum TaxID=1492 RepID=UPI0004005D73|nr:DNA adenine methylase [Clostridium butyricum]
MKETIDEVTYLDKDVYKSSENLQLNLFEDNKTNRNSSIRPIHYLGSKLRLLEIIKNVIDEVDSTQGTVCDLFAGSGTVSKYLSTYRPVVSVDIQEYSRVLCSALLNPQASSYTTSEFIDMCKNSSHSIKLKMCFNDLQEYEKECIRKGELGDLEPVCDLLDNGSIISYEQGYKGNVSTKLSNIMDKVINRMKELNFHNGPEALVIRYFGGLYFSYKQAIEIDSILEQIFNLEKKCIDTYLAALLSTASDVVNTVGKQFAQPIKPRNADGTPKKNIIKNVQKDRNIDVFESFDKWLNIYLNQEKTNQKHMVYKSDYVDALNFLDNNVKVVYADPPYTRYHYSRYYHVLETICLRDNPKLSMNIVKGEKKISRGIYREDRHQSPFSIKTQSYNAFKVMFEKVSRIGAALILSYSPFDDSKENTPRILSISQIEEIAKKYFNSVEVVSVGQFSHSKLNKNDKNFEINYNAELLIVCKDSIRMEQINE